MKNDNHSGGVPYETMIRDVVESNAVYIGELKEEHKLKPSIRDSERALCYFTPQGVMIRWTYRGTDNQRHKEQERLLPANGMTVCGMTYRKIHTFIDKLQRGTIIHSPDYFAPYLKLVGSRKHTWFISGWGTDFPFPQRGGRSAEEYTYPVRLYLNKETMAEINNLIEKHNQQWELPEDI